MIPPPVVKMIAAATVAVYGLVRIVAVQLGDGSIPIGEIIAAGGAFGGAAVLLRAALHGVKTVKTSQEEWARKDAEIVDLKKENAELRADVAQRIIAVATLEAEVITLRAAADTED